MPNDLYPDDISTIFSIAPFGSPREFKPGLLPGTFVIPPCTDDSRPSRLEVGASYHLMQLAGKKQPLRVVTPSYEIAKSIVVDYLDGQLFSDPEAHPGICWIQGNISVQEFLVKHKEKYLTLKQVQRNWFVSIVKKTEDDWNKYQNSRVVSDQARFAVRALGLETPVWMRVDEMAKETSKCPACGIAVDPTRAWCPNCIQGGIKVIINKEVYASLKLGE